MCTLIILRRPGHAWPLLVAGNRDEMRDRPWAAPGRHWQDRPDVLAGLDQLAGGSWLGINDHGVVAVVTNREGSLGPDPTRRSRGELVLEALDHAEAGQASRALAELEPRAYRPFNLFIGDPVAAYWLRATEQEPAVAVREGPPGLHMFTARDLDDPRDPRIRHYLPQFRQAETPDPGTDTWGAWPRLLASRLHAHDQGPRAAMNLDLANGFGTVCSHLIAIPRYPGFDHRPEFLFAAGPPDRTTFEPITL